MTGIEVGGGVGLVPLDEHGYGWFECPCCGERTTLRVAPEPVPGTAYGKAIGCYGCHRTFDTAAEAEAHERAAGHGKGQG